MAKLQSTKKGLSEKIVKEALEKFDRKTLMAHLVSLQWTEEAVDRLISIMREGGLPLIKHVNPNARAKRASCIAAIEAHLETVLGSSQADKLRALVSLISRIEEGYGEILAASDACSGARLDPKIRISALLAAGLQEAREHHARLMAELDVAGTLDGHGLSLPGAREGDRIDPEVAVDSAVQAVTMSLLMQGHRHKLFDKNGIFEIPAPVSVADADVTAVHSILYYAQSWRFWEYVEQDARYFGGDIEAIGLEEIADEWREQGVHKFWRHNSESLLWGMIDLAANQRLAQQLGQNYFEVIHSSAAAKRVGIAGTAALPPNEFISADELHSLWALRQALSIEPTEHHERYFNLTLVEWLRGYSALRALAGEGTEQEADSSSSMKLIPRRTLIRTLQRLGLKGRTAENFIQHTLLCRSSRDLFDTPLIAVEGDQVLLYGPALGSAIAAQVTLSRLSSLKQSFEIRGPAFERAMLALMQAQGLRAVSVEEKRGSEVYDYDLLVRWDPYVFLFECKSRSLSGANKIRSYRFLSEVELQIKQVTRLVEGLRNFPDILDHHLGAGASSLKLVPCVLNALPFAPGELDGIYFCDASGVGRLFESAHFNNILASSTKPTIKLPSFRLWAGDSVVAEDLMRQLDRSPQWQMALAEMRQQACFASLAPGIVASTDRIVRHPLSHAERIASLQRPTAERADAEVGPAPSYDGDSELPH